VREFLLFMTALHALLVVSGLAILVWSAQDANWGGAFNGGLCAVWSLHFGVKAIDEALS
jgi:thiosulfate reductase cytochrome b subunit